MLDKSSPRDLPSATARRLVRLGRRVWIAEVTGKDRDRWPGYFPAGPLAHPYYAVRVQAAIARRAAGGRAVVDLVWAGASTPSGVVVEDRTGQVRLTHSQGGAAWAPLR